MKLKHSDYYLKINLPCILSKSISALKDQSSLKTIPFGVAHTYIAPHPSRVSGWFCYSAALLEELKNQVVLSCFPVFFSVVNTGAARSSYASLDEEYLWPSVVLYGLQSMWIGCWYDNKNGQVLSAFFFLCLLFS